MTDDQRWDTLWAMSTLQERLLPESVAFTQAFVTIPMCCPERASMLSGGFPPAETGVLTNSWPNGGALRFDDTDTMAVRFRSAGYTTGLFGKYLNEYEEISPHIPPGWSRFVTQADNAPDWNDFEVVEGGIGEAGAVIEVEDYLTDWFTQQALSFIDRADGTPFFLYVPVRAPHSPATPAPGDEVAFEDYLWRGGAWGEKDVTDKPDWVQASSPMNDTNAIDDLVRRQLATLQAVDRGLGVLMDGLEAAGVAENTVFVFTSDNGFMWGEHNQRSKGMPYEESIRVPLLIAAPGIAPGTVEALVAMNLDLPATLYALAGVDAPTTGLDLGPLMRGEVDGVRDRILIEGYSGGQPIWSGVRTETVKYVEYATGETEHYDLSADPTELESLSEAPDPEVVSWLADNRGLAVTTDVLDAATVGAPYSVTITTWGGTAPLGFSITSGMLPDGLTMADGVISGTPTMAGSFYFWVQVSDASVGVLSGEPQEFIARYTLEVEL
ncbi:MAG: N-acetylglucosamine-6-sulfatase [Myxococcota bacterium]|jgi:N-acetylglucosamine-6-sulfatase